MISKTVKHTKELSCVYHHTKFERNQPVNVWMQANTPPPPPFLLRPSPTPKKQGSTPSVA